MKMRTIVALTASASPFAWSEPLVFDSFSEGGFDLVFRIRPSDSDTTVSPFVDRRIVSIFESGPSSTAFLDASVGIMRYDLERDSGNSRLTLDYRKTGGAFSLAGYTGFEFEIPELIGIGSLYMTINNGDFASFQLVPITEPGIVQYMFSEPLGNPLSGVQFYFLAESEDFSIAIDQINVVPEPTGAIFSALGLGILGALRRRR